MEEKIKELEEGQKRIENDLKGLREETTNRFEGVDGRLDKVEGRLDKVEGRLESVEGRLGNVESALETLIQEVRITNNTLQGVFNVGFESYKNVALQREAAEMLSKAYEEVFQKLSRKIV